MRGLTTRFFKGYSRGLTPIVFTATGNGRWFAHLPPQANADGSVDLYFGPKAPAGKVGNWTATVPGKGWFAIFRAYGPLEAWFDKTWRPGEIELVQWG